MGSPAFLRVMLHLPGFSLSLPRLFFSCTGSQFGLPRLFLWPLEARKRAFGVLSGLAGAEGTELAWFQGGSMCFPGFAGVFWRMGTFSWLRSVCLVVMWSTEGESRKTGVGGLLGLFWG